MQTKAGVNIHNKFEIEVMDTRTGEIRQKAEAYNIVLDGMWARLVGLTTYFVNICFGTGTGTLDATRTTLFNYLGYKAAANDTLIKATPVSSWKRKIVLNPEEYVGSIITEVGISNTYPTILTHALLKDAEGNPISITKTSTDVVTIYATVYVTFSTQDINQIKFVGMPSNNPLVNWLIGGTNFPTCYFYMGENGGTISNTNYAVMVSSALGTSSSVTSANWIKDTANKKATTPAIRFGITMGNGHIKEIGFGNSLAGALYRSVLPITGVFTGQSYSGVSIGSGDGLTKEFILPSKNINQDSITIKADGVINTGITKTLINRDINFTLSSPSPSPTGTGYGCALSGDGKVLAVAHDGSPFFSVYNWDGGSWVKRVNPTELPTNVTNGCALSSDGKTLAVAYSGLPYILTYDWDGGLWVKRANPTELPISVGVRCALSDDGKILVVSCPSSPFIFTYDWDGSAWVKRATPTEPPTGSGRGCVLSGDGKILAVVHSVSPYISTYDWDGSAWIRRATPTELPTGAGYGCALSDDSKILAVVNNVTPYISTYDWDGSSWIKRATPTTLPTGSPYDCSLSGDGKILAVAHDVSPFLSVYDWDGGSWVKRANPTILPAGIGRGCALCGGGGILAVTHNNGAYVTTYDLKKRETKITFDTAPASGVAITADYTVDGIHKTDQYVVDVSFSLQFGEVV